MGSFVSVRLATSLSRCNFPQVQSTGRYSWARQSERGFMFVSVAFHRTEPRTLRYFDDKVYCNGNAGVSDCLGCGLCYPRRTTRRGSRVTVRDIHARVEKRGLKPPRVAERFNLDVAPVYEALAYYHNNPEEMARVENRHARAKTEAKRRSSLHPLDS